MKIAKLNCRENIEEIELGEETNSVNLKIKIRGLEEYQIITIYPESRKIFLNGTLFENKT